LLEDGEVAPRQISARLILVGRGLAQRKKKEKRKEKEKKKKRKIYKIIKNWKRIKK